MLGQMDSERVIFQRVCRKVQELDLRPDTNANTGVFDLQPACVARAKAALAMPPVAVGSASTRDTSAFCMVKNCACSRLQLARKVNWLAQGNKTNVRHFI